MKPTGVEKGDVVMFTGLRIIEDVNLVDLVEDWSRVRSPSRAERRRRMGHKQNIIIRAVPKTEVYCVGDTLVMHPMMVNQIRAMVPLASGTSGGLF